MEHQRDNRWQLTGVIDHVDREDPEIVLVADLELHPHPSYDIEANLHIIEAAKEMYGAIKQVLAIRNSLANTPEGSEPLPIPWDSLVRAIKTAEEGYPTTSP